MFTSLQMQARRPPVSMLTVDQVEMIEIGMGVSSGLSVVCSAAVVAYVLVKLWVQHRRRAGGRTMNAVVTAASRSSGEFMATDFTKSVEVLETVGSAQDRDWLLLWFSELAVLALMIASLGSALWYFLQLHVLGVSCNKALAFFGTIFEPASVLCVTFISMSMLILVVGSLSLQTRKSMKRTVTTLLFLCFFVSYFLPMVLALAYLVQDQYGPDSVYCWLSPIKTSTHLRLFSYYLPIMLLLVANIGFSIAILVINLTQKMGLSNLSLLWVPLGLIVVWFVPTISTSWSNISSDGVPFPVVFMSSLLLPCQGLFNAILFAILLGREKKIVHETITSIITDDDMDERDAFATDEVKLRVFGEQIVWYFVD